MPFHSCSLEKETLPLTNKEAHGRESRLRFFQKIYQEINAQSLLLAHQAEDYAETVLKRIFEGAHLKWLGTMSPKDFLNGMVLWRPLLSVRKAKLFQWLKMQGIEDFFVDSTNLDTQFLRGKLRREILPFLSAKFGKDITSNLCKMGSSASELNAYFSRKLQSHFFSIRESPFGVHWDLSPYLPMEKIELEYLLRDFFRQRGVVISFQAFETMLVFLQEKTPNKQVDASIQEAKVPLYLDRGQLFLLLEMRKLDWELISERVEERVKATDWRGLFRGEMSVCLPEGEYVLASAISGLSLRKTWNQAQVPAFLRDLIPFICQNNTIVHDFLTGNSFLDNNIKPLRVISIKAVIKNK